MNNPEQAGVRLLRASVLRTITALESFRGTLVAEKVLDILRALGPLYTEEFLPDTREDRERTKQAVSARRVENPIPYVDSPNVPNGAAEVTDSAHADSPRPEPGPDSTPAPHPSGQATRKRRYCRCLLRTCHSHGIPRAEICPSGIHRSTWDDDNRDTPRRSSSGTRMCSYARQAEDEEAMWRLVGAPRAPLTDRHCLSFACSLRKTDVPVFTGWRYWRIGWADGP
jgi:hypothetical protein